jgi:glycosyltransferase involved in cell wall biosynthesis
LFKGFIRGDEKYDLIKSASAMLVYPTSENDAFPTVFLESWACGTPVVAARIGALTSLITNTDAGILVEPHDPAALARAVQGLLSDSAARRRLSERGLQAVAHRFLWKTSVGATAKLFAEISKKTTT